jgi:hypothetical protein
MSVIMRLANQPDLIGILFCYDFFLQFLPSVLDFLIFHMGLGRVLLIFFFIIFWPVLFIVVVFFYLYYLNYQLDQ